MARRDITNYNTVTNVVAEEPDKLAPALAEIGQDIIRKSQEAKIVENLSTAQLELGKLSNDFQTQYQGDPFNEQGMKDFRSQRQGILDKYGEGISPLFGRAWKDSAAKLASSNDVATQAWGFKQAHVNTIQSINTSLKNNYATAYQEGRRFGAGDTSEVDVFAAYAAMRKPLEDYGLKNLGASDTATLFEGADKDYMKSYISGVAEANPQKAAELLSNENIKEMFDVDERTEFAAVIKKTEAIKKFQKSMTETEGGGRVYDIVNDEEADYYSKRLAIDTMEMEGQISTKTATRARRVLTSQNDVDAITNTPVMSDMITRMYDLNAMQETNSEGYLEGVQNIREEIMQRQAAGELTAPDAKKLNNQLKTLTSAKMSDATQRVGMEFYDAQKKFELLPPEFRGRATRELFYKTQGREGVSKETYDRYADDIVATTNHERRTATLKRLEAVQATDTDFLKANNITMEEVSQTAKSRNMTEAQVIRAIKAKLVNEMPTPAKTKAKSNMTEAEKAAAIVDVFGAEEEE